MWIHDKDDEAEIDEGGEVHEDARIGVRRCEQCMITNPGLCRCRDATNRRGERVEDRVTGRPRTIERDCE